MSTLLMSQPPRASAVPHQATSAAAATASSALAHGPVLTLTSVGIGPKDRMVLRSLVRLLDDRHGMRLRFSEEIGICNVVFVAGSSEAVLPPHCVAVQVLDIVTPGFESEDAASLGLQTPLRASNVLPALQRAAQRLAAGTVPMPEAAARAGGAPAAPAQPQPGGLEGLFRALSSALSTPTAHPVMLRLEGGAQVLIDPAHDHVHSELPPSELLAGHYRLLSAGAPGKEECIAFARLPAVRLRRMVWLAAALLSDAQAPIAARAGHYRLLRWPDASVLGRPGHPRFAALLTSRPMTLAQVSAACEIEPLTIRWLLEASLAVGIAVPVDDDPLEPKQEREHGPRDEPHPDLDPMPPTRRQNLDIFSRLRERLRLW